MYIIGDNNIYNIIILLCSVFISQNILVITGKCEKCHASSYLRKLNVKRNTYK